MAAGAHRTMGIGIDYSPSSKSAVQWAVDNLAHAGDHLVLIHVLSKSDNNTQKQLWEEKGSRAPVILCYIPALIPLDEFEAMNLTVQYGIAPDKEVFQILDTAARIKQVKVMAKIYWGDPREKICDAVEDLKLDLLVLGSRGLGAIKRVLIGSVSNYVVLHATCPVTVVKSNDA